MPSDPNLIFALLSSGLATQEALSQSIPIFPMTRRHTCLNGMKVYTCRSCAGHVLRGKRPCAGCNGRGFTTEKCEICAEKLAMLVQAMGAAAAAVATEEQGQGDAGIGGRDERRGSDFMTFQSEKLKED